MLNTEESKKTESSGSSTEGARTRSQAKTESSGSSTEGARTRSQAKTESSGSSTEEPSNSIALSNPIAFHDFFSSVDNLERVKEYIKRFFNVDTQIGEITIYPRSHAEDGYLYVEYYDKTNKLSYVLYNPLLIPKRHHGAIINEVKKLGRQVFLSGTDEDRDTQTKKFLTGTDEGRGTQTKRFGITSVYLLIPDCSQGNETCDIRDYITKERSYKFSEVYESPGDFAIYKLREEFTTVEFHFALPIGNKMISFLNYTVPIAGPSTWCAKIMQDRIQAIQTEYTRQCDSGYQHGSVARSFSSMGSRLSTSKDSLKYALSELIQKKDKDPQASELLEAFMSQEIKRMREIFQKNSAELKEKRTKDQDARAEQEEKTGKKKTSTKVELSDPTYDKSFKAMIEATRHQLLVDILLDPNPNENNDNAIVALPTTISKKYASSRFLEIDSFAVTFHCNKWVFLHLEMQRRNNTEDIDRRKHYKDYVTEIAEDFMKEGQLSQKDMAVKSGWIIRQKPSQENEYVVTLSGTPSSVFYSSGDYDVIQNDIESLDLYIYNFTKKFEDKKFKERFKKGAFQDLNVRDAWLYFFSQYEELLTNDNDETLQCLCEKSPQFFLGIKAFVEFYNLAKSRNVTTTTIELLFHYTSIIREAYNENYEIGRYNALEGRQFCSKIVDAFAKNAFLTVEQQLKLFSRHRHYTTKLTTGALSEVGPLSVGEHLSLSVGSHPFTKHIQKLFQVYCTIVKEEEMQLPDHSMLFSPALHTPGKPKVHTPPAPEVSPNFEKPTDTTISSDLLNDTDDSTDLSKIVNDSRLQEVAEDPTEEGDRGADSDRLDRLMQCFLMQYAYSVGDFLKANFSPTEFPPSEKELLRNAPTFIKWFKRRFVRSMFIVYEDSDDHNTIMERMACISQLVHDEKLIVNEAFVIKGYHHDGEHAVVKEKLYILENLLRDVDADEDSTLSEFFEIYEYDYRKQNILYDLFIRIILVEYAMLFMWEEEVPIGVKMYTESQGEPTRESCVHMLGMFKIIVKNTLSKSAEKVDGNQPSSSTADATKQAAVFEGLNINAIKQMLRDGGNQEAQDLLKKQLHESAEKVDGNQPSSSTADATKQAAALKEAAEESEESAVSTPDHNLDDPDVKSPLAKRGKK